VKQFTLIENTAVRLQVAGSKERMLTYWTISGLFKSNRREIIVATRKGKGSPKKSTGKKTSRHRNVSIILDLDELERMYRRQHGKDDGDTKGGGRKRERDGDTKGGRRRRERDGDTKGSQRRRKRDGDTKG
jgi:hypothetical protein